ncbi:MAG: 3-deoxy-manno-octulosonate cytidylyltransferase [Planctomycetes bacterium]|nr:3-deoxy-manno-octulosonate cytidylyltransferase [Planctomycetota bacterium]
MGRVIVIPARLRSERLPRKLLLDESGWPLIRHTVEQCRRVPGVARVVVAADGEEIADAVRQFGGEVVLTDPELRTGTDRVAAACAALGLGVDDPGDATCVVNVQGDEPEIDPAHVDALFEMLETAEPSTGRSAVVATLATPRRDSEGFADPNRVKVVTDGAGFALYFSRSGIPFPRGDSVPWLCHVGIYGFRPGALHRFSRTPPTPLERTEKLEQLRFLELGLSIRVGTVGRAAPGIDTFEDYRAFLARCRSESAG